MPIPARTALAICAVLACGSAAIAAPACTGDGITTHATALIGEPKYPKGFARFENVNPDAPKGGVLRLSETGRFDTFNPALSKGELAAGLGYVYETLMTGSLDEVSAEYGLIADSVSWPCDYGSVTYTINPAARFHDGHPITAEDVVWSFEKLVELNPSQRFYYQHVTAAEAVDERTVRFSFDEKNNRELPAIVGQMLVMPKHWWEGADASGRQRNIAEPTLEPPLGSGPYRIKTFSPGSTLTLERVPDAWAKDLNVNVGRHNFEEIRYTYFLDRSVEFEAFKADAFDYWDENEAKRWATAYDFPRADQIVREELPNDLRQSGVMVGFVPNLRREVFADVRVRKALNLAFDFETLNRSIFYDQYQRIGSFFHGTELASSGLPEGEELEILQSLKDKIPPSVFTDPYVNPVNGEPGQLRDNLRTAQQLLIEAGYERRDGKLVHRETGKPLSFELLLNGPIIERVALPYAEDLRKIGVTMTIRTVDAAQYLNRLRGRDYDMVYSGWGQSLSPGNEQMDYWGSAAAAREASRNYAGIADPGVDELIRRVVFADDRETLVAATRALDRVLLAHQYVIPSYTLRFSRIAYWNRFSHPDPLPEYSIGFPTIWWFDEAKAARLPPQR